MARIKKIVIVSDGSGKTAQRLMDSVLAQYAEQEVRYEVKNIYQQVRSKNRLKTILKEIDTKYLVVFSLISDELRGYFHDTLEKKGILHLNVLEPMLETMSKFLGVHPEYKPGLLQIVDDKYYKKIDAIGFTVEHDDGHGYRLNQAEVVLVGASRTCKTPIAMYMACNHGLRVSNIPIVANESMKTDLLKRLKSISSRRIFGLSIQPEALAAIREERSSWLGGEQEKRAGLHDYRNLHEIQQELRFCRFLYSAQNWKVVDVTKRAIEEIALEILRKLKKKNSS